MDKTIFDHAREAGLIDLDPTLIDQLRETMNKEAAAAREKFAALVTDFCIHAGLPGAAAASICQTGEVEMHGTSLHFHCGTAFDPHALQVSLDLGPAPANDLAGYYRTLLLSNMLMGGFGGIFAVDPATGNAVNFVTLPLQEARGEDLARYADVLTRQFSEFSALNANAGSPHPASAVASQRI